MVAAFLRHFSPPRRSVIMPVGPAVDRQRNLLGGELPADLAFNRGERRQTATATAPQQRAEACRAAWWRSAAMREPERQAGNGRAGQIDRVMHAVYRWRYVSAATHRGFDSLPPWDRTAQHRSESAPPHGLRPKGQSAPRPSARRSPTRRRSSPSGTRARPGAGRCGSTRPSAPRFAAGLPWLTYVPRPAAVRPGQYGKLVRAFPRRRLACNILMVATQKKLRVNAMTKKILAAVIVLSFVNCKRRVVGPGCGRGQHGTEI